MQYGPTLVFFKLLFVLGLHTTWAQDSLSSITKKPSNQIGFEMGFINGYFKDLNFSPLNYTESGSLFSLSYIREKPEGRHRLTVDADFASGQMKTDVTDFFYAQHILGNIEVSYLWRLGQRGNKNLSYFLGPQYNSFIQYVDWNDQSGWSYLATHGLNIKGLACYKASDRSRFEMSISIPVVQLFVRPPYNGYDLYIQENSENVLKLAFRGEIASFDQYIAVDWKTVYRYAASNRLDFIFGYLFRYQGVSGYNKVTHFQNQFTLGFAIKF